MYRKLLDEYISVKEFTLVLIKTMLNDLYTANTYYTNAFNLKLNINFCFNCVTFSLFLTPNRSNLFERREG